MKVQKDTENYTVKVMADPGDGLLSVVVHTPLTAKNGGIEALKDALKNAELILENDFKGKN